MIPPERKATGTIYGADESETHKDYLRQLFDEVGEQKRVAEILGLKKTRVSNFVNEDLDVEISLLRAWRLTSAKATAMARGFARKAGGVFCPLPKAEGGAAMLLTTEAMRQHTEAITAIIESHRDGVFTVPEAEAAKKEIEEALCAMGALYGLCLARLEKD